MAKLIDLKESINPINYIAQSVLAKLRAVDLATRNNIVVSEEGYALDCVIPRKHNYRLAIRMDYMKNLCNILVDKKGFVLKYDSSFMISYQKGVFSTNLEDDKYDLEQLKAYVVSIKELDGIDPVGLAETLILCKRLYNEIISE